LRDVEAPWLGNKSKQLGRGEVSGATHLAGVAGKVSPKKRGGRSKRRGTSFLVIGRSSWEKRGVSPGRGEGIRVEKRGTQKSQGGKKGKKEKGGNRKSADSRGRQR